MKKNPDLSPKNDQTEKGAENTCAEDETAHMLSAKSLRLIVIMLRRALVAALKLCDQLAEQLKTK